MLAILHLLSMFIADMFKSRRSSSDEHAPLCYQARNGIFSGGDDTPKKG
jgi:hypothetical protein